VGNVDSYTIKTLTEGATSFCTVTAYDPAKVESTFSNEVAVFVPYAVPNVNFGMSPTAGAAPLSVAFANTTSGQVTAWNWDFGDGSRSNAKSPTHIYSTPGDYTVSLTATGPGGETSKVSTAPIVVSSTGMTVSDSAKLGLVAAYNFNEGSRTIVLDVSGRNNSGTLAGGVAWTNQGKFGNALVFDGVSGVVTIPDSDSLRLSTGMTLEAWVKPSIVDNQWRDVIYKGDDNYYLEASSTNGGKPAGRASLHHVYGATALPVGAWTYLATTYDGATLRFYINATEVSSIVIGAGIDMSAYPLQIGGDALYGQYFHGVIDEVRVYSRALSQTEIQQDMTTPISP
jgi:PKD repeat protein